MPFEVPHEMPTWTPSTQHGTSRSSSLSSLWHTSSAPTSVGSHTQSLGPHLTRLFMGPRPCGTSLQTPRSLVHEKSHRIDPCGARHKTMARAAVPARVVAAAAAEAPQQVGQPPLSLRVRETDAPVIVRTKKLVATTEGTLSLAQGGRQEACTSLTRWIHSSGFAGVEKRQQARTASRWMTNRAGNGWQWQIMQAAPFRCVGHRLTLRLPSALLCVAGIVHWQPPPEALQLASQMATDPAVSAYGPDDGLPALREALRQKIRTENGLDGVSAVSVGSRGCHSVTHPSPAQQPTGSIPWLLASA